MMHFFDTTWPWSVPPGNTFLLLFIVGGAIAAGVGLIVQFIVGHMLDGPVLRSLSSREAASSAGVTAPSQPFMIGRLPSQDDLPFLAYLRGGQSALEEFMYASARQAGIISLNGDEFSIGSSLLARDPPTKDFIARMSGGTVKLVTVTNSLRIVGHDYAARYQARAEQIGLSRTVDRRVVLTLIGIGGALVADFAAVVRIVVRASLYDGAVFPRNLVMAMGILTVATGYFAWRSSHRHRQVRAYLRWLDDVTESLKGRVQTGTAPPNDVLTVTASPAAKPSVSRRRASPFICCGPRRAAQAHRRRRRVQARRAVHHVVRRAAAAVAVRE